MNVVIIVASARKDGETNASVQQLQEYLTGDVVYLSDYNIGHYDYNNANSKDDYLDLVKNLLQEYDTWILATPVYWYLMSGLLKVFFDRMTDLLTIDKATGRLLRGKKMAVLTCSYGNNLGAYFWFPFQESANYLGRHYLGGVHTLGNQDNRQRLQDFVHRVTTKT